MTGESDTVSNLEQRRLCPLNFLREKHVTVQGSQSNVQDRIVSVTDLGFFLAGNIERNVVTFVGVDRRKEDGFSCKLGTDARKNF